MIERSRAPVAMSHNLTTLSAPALANYRPPGRAENVTPGGGGPACQKNEAAGETRRPVFGDDAGVPSITIIIPLACGFVAFHTSKTTAQASWSMT